MLQSNILKSKYIQSIFSNLSLSLFGILTNVNPVYLFFFLLFEIFIAIAASMMNSSKSNKGKKKVNNNFLIKIIEFPFRLFWRLWTVILFSFVVLTFFYFSRDAKISLRIIFSLILIINWFYKTLKYDLAAKKLEIGRPFLGGIIFIAGATLLQSFNSNLLLILWFFISTTIADFVLIVKYKDKIDIPTII